MFPTISHSRSYCELISSRTFLDRTQYFVYQIFDVHMNRLYLQIEKVASNIIVHYVSVIYQQCLLLRLHIFISLTLYVCCICVVDQICVETKLLKHLQ